MLRYNNMYLMFCILYIQVPNNMYLYKKLLEIKKIRVCSNDSIYITPSFKITLA